MEDKRYMVLVCRNKSEVACSESIKEKFGDECDVVLFFEKMMIRPRHKKSAKPVESERPVYPGYLFVWLSPHRFWVELKACKNVYGVLAANGVPYRVPKERLVPHIPPKKLSPVGFSSGEGVRVFAGPLEGKVGTFVNNGLIELNMFGRVTRVQVPVALLERIVMTPNSLLDDKTE